MRITLRVVKGPHKGRDFVFEEHNTFIVGRSPKANFHLSGKDRYFSRLHFLVEVNPPLCRLLDMGSRNGTYVNKQRVRSVDLRDQDLIWGGKTAIRVSIMQLEAPLEPEEPAAPEVPPEPAPPTPSAAKPPPHSRESDNRTTLDPAVCPACGAALEPVPLSSRPDRTFGMEPDQLTPNLCRACVELATVHPQPIDGYRIIRPLGKGGMGVVYLAIRLGDGSVTALKTVLPAHISDVRSVGKFLREAEILRELSHPNIVAFREMGQCGGHCFFAMDYVQGTDVDRVIKTKGPMDVGRAVRLACQALEALEYAHQRGKVHRDIKPSNILLTERRGVETAMLADFGLARVYEASPISGLTRTLDIGGTIPFMAPEQVKNFREAKPPADQYSLGATLYNMLTGKYIFDFREARVHEMLSKVLEGRPVPILDRRSDIPNELAAIIDRTLEKEPQDRFADDAVLREALLPFANAAGSI